MSKVIRGDKCVDKVAIISIYLIICSLFTGSLQLFGPISCRHLCIVALLLLSFVYRRGRLPLQSVTLSYILFLFFYILSAFFNGTIFNYDTLRFLITFHGSCFVLIITFASVINNQLSLDYFYKTLRIFFVINCLFTIGQYHNIYITWAIPKFLCPSGIENTYAMFDDFSSRGTSTLNASIVMGLMGFVVENGYFTCCLLPLLTYKGIISPKNRFDSITCILIILISAVSIFYIQQRMALILFLLYIATLLIVLLRKNTILALFGIFICIYMCIEAANLDMGRLNMNDISSDGRMTQILNIKTFLETDYWLFGGDFSHRTSCYMGHNTLTDALRRGGVFLMPFYLIFLGSILHILFKGITTKATPLKLNLQIVGGAISCLYYVLYSTTHSTGIQSGSLLFWCILSYLIEIYKLGNPLSSKNHFSLFKA